MSKVACSLLILVAILVSASPAVARQGQQASLPEGVGRELVQATCSSCHGLNQITNSAGYSAAGWRGLFSTMVSLPDADAIRVAEYLATNFPPRAGRAPTLVTADVGVEVEFSEWIVPTLGQRSRDAAEAPDGSIWWTGMWASLAGRLDPSTGEMKEFPLPPTARPHTVVPDQDGNIWYTGNSNATIGRLDPRTGQIAEYPTKARDPHSAVFHPNGNLYFTAQAARVVGRLNPETGVITEVPTEANPYGIQVDLRGTVWVAHNGTNKVAAVDPETLEIRFYDLPDPASRVRRLGITSDGMVWFVNSSLGRIGRLDPTTGEVKEWASPSGPDSHPYALAVVNDVIWYNESGKRPDTLVRFDPQTEAFRSWPIPSGYGIVRNMWVTREGNLLIHQTSSNRVGVVTIRERVPRISQQR